MRAFWSDKLNSTLYDVGQILAQVVEGKTLAEHIAEGHSFTLGAVKSPNEVRLQLRPGQVFSLATLNSWGCPACHSAHGSGRYPSREVDSKGLASNVFYYRPADQTLFTISRTCWQQYVIDLGATKGNRFAEPTPMPVKAKVSAPTPTPVPAPAIA
jgi:hypothetical protein